MTLLIKNLFHGRPKSFSDSDISSLGVLPSTAESLKKFDIFYYFETWYKNSIFPTYPNWKNIVRDNILHFETSAWHSYCDTHPEMQIASSCLTSVIPFHFWFLADQIFPRLSRLHVQVRLMGQFGLSGSIPWLRDSDGAFCFVCKQDVESVTHFLLGCSYFKQNFLSLWRNLKLKITVSNQADEVNVCQFIENLDRHHKEPLLFCLPFNNITNTLIKRFIAEAVGKIQKLRRKRLCELEAPWLTKK